jgi:tRNA(Leu) C34 or U34 (ribose-2'-O)-methylase TrmL
MTQRTVLGKDSKAYGKAPSIILVDPKYDHNVAAAVRAASCFGLEQVWFTGNRVQLEGDKRLPREERMRGYDQVELVQFDYPVEQFENVVPIAIEVRPNSEPLPSFEHPENAVYLFGPEDGHLTKPWTRLCHRFVSIPVKHCMNLASAIYVVLYDRLAKQGDNLTIAHTLNEDRSWVNNERKGNL